MIKPVHSELSEALIEAPPSAIRPIAPSVPETEQTITSSGALLLGERDYRLTGRRTARAIFLLGAKMLSHEVVEVLSRHATKKKYAWVDLSAYLLMKRGRALPSGWRLQHLLYATFLNHVIEPNMDSLAIARAALRSVIRHPNAEKAFTDARLFQIGMNVAALTRDRKLAARLQEFGDSDIAEIGWQTAADLQRPAWAQSDAQKIDQWWQMVNQPFLRHGVEPWEFACGRRGQSAFDRIHAPRVPQVVTPKTEQPLISVIVPCYNPSASFIQTIESLRRQSWRNIEVLVVDDASTSGRNVFWRSWRFDRRVRVIRQPRNGGAYCARNAGLAAARGEFVTFLDADDLAHSRRLELQVQPLLEQPELMATLSLSLRMHGNGRITSFATAPFRTNLSSLMFRRERALERIGYYDEVRKAADSEYRERIEAVFGAESVAMVRVPLSIVQLTTGSLSRGDFRSGSDWMSGARVSYREQYRAWHATLKASQSRLPLPPAATVRPFAASRKLLGQEEPAIFDVAVLSEWSHYLDHIDRLVDETEACARQLDTRIGLLHGVSLRTTHAGRRQTAIAESVFQLVERHSATWMSWAQSSEVGTLVVADPEYLMALPVSAEIGIRVDRVIVRLDRVIPSRDGEEGILRPDVVDERCRRAFGADPYWLPADATLAKHLGTVPVERVLKAGGRVSDLARSS